MNETDLFAEVLDRIDSFLAGAGDMRSTAAQAEAFLADGEAVLSAWLVAKGQQPTDETVEGFRLLALHRQGARGDPSFNACRETCREIIYLRNVITLYDDDTAECRHQLRLQ
uniref:hypothetical protein n=1 Tax=Phaeovulum sp. TaxID=2934796 RepID=UPI0035698DB6